MIAHSSRQADSETVEKRTYIHLVREKGILFCLWLHSRTAVYVTASDQWRGGAECKMTNKVLPGIVCLS